MPILDQLSSALASGAVEVVDLTARLGRATPVIRLPEPFANTVSFSLTRGQPVRRRGPAWYWNNITAGEHTGTHFDAPVHWISGRDGLDVSQVPPASLIATGRGDGLQRAEAAATRTSCSRSTHIEAWERGARPTARAAAGCCTAPAGTRAADRPGRVSQRERDRAHTPGVSVECARWLARETPVIGPRASRRSGTDAGAAHTFDPPFPCHSDCSVRASTG